MASHGAWRWLFCKSPFIVEMYSALTRSPGRYEPASHRTCFHAGSIVPSCSCSEVIGGNEALPHGLVVSTYDIIVGFRVCLSDSQRKRPHRSRLHPYPHRANVGRYPLSVDLCTRTCTPNHRGVSHDIICCLRDQVRPGSHIAGRHLEQPHDGFGVSLGQSSPRARNLLSWRLSYLATFCHGITSISVICARSRTFEVVVNWADRMQRLLDYMPTYFQACMGASPMRSSVQTLPIALTLAPFALAGGLTVKLSQTYRPVNLIGWVIGVAGFAVLSTLKSDTPLARWVGFQFLVAAGIGVNVRSSNIFEPDEYTTDHYVASSPPRSSRCSLRSMCRGAPPRSPSSPSAARSRRHGGSLSPRRSYRTSSTAACPPRSPRSSLPASRSRTLPCR